MFARHVRFRWLGLLGLGLLLIGPLPGFAADAAAQRFAFPEVGVTFEADFPAARLDDCTRTADGRFRLLSRAETTPINNSPWYACRVRSEKQQSIEVEFAYQGGSHRYAPKVSRDGRTWTRPSRADYRVVKGEPPRLRLDVGPQPLWLAGQELVVADDLYAWARGMAQHAAADESVIGQSVCGRDLRAWTFGAAPGGEMVTIIGRQHPPEVTGSLALMAFVDRLAGDDDLARRFRRRFQVLVVPLMNPDGVASGHWRCNMNRVDMNRDWGKFAQPETRAVRDELQRRTAAGKRLRLLLDFHSTGHDVFYTQRDSDPTDPPDFTRLWLDDLHAKRPDYQIRREGAHGETLATSKSWGYATYRVPAITYELGDETDRTLIRDVARAAAEAMMRVLLGDVAAQPAQEAAPKESPAKKAAALPAPTSSSDRYSLWSPVGTAGRAVFRRAAA